MAEDRRETRKILWGQCASELDRANDFDAEAERHGKMAANATEQAAACRARADGFTKAAEELGKLDSADGVVDDPPIAADPVKS